MTFPAWLLEFPHLQPVAWTVLILATTAIVGLALGTLRIKGIGLGVAGVLFAGIGLGALKAEIPGELLGFIREFGLILFVYTIGIQVGPGFFTSLKRQGLPLNLLAASIVIMGAVIAWLGTRIFHFDMALVAGLFSGATTNTPSLGAVQDALRTITGATPERLALPGLGYAVSYPFGIMGIILAMILLRTVFRIDPRQELQKFRTDRRGTQQTLQRLNVRVDNANIDGLRIGEFPGLSDFEVVVSRLCDGSTGEVRNVSPEMVVHRGDTLLAVGTPQDLHEFQLVVGSVSEMDLIKGGHLTFQRVLVTKKNVLGKSLRHLALDQSHGVTVTRVIRADLELAARPELSLEFGDMVQIVGPEQAVADAARTLGNSVKEMGHTNYIPVFLGIALGILLGMVPIRFPGMVTPIRLGLAGGPLIVAILLSRIGRIGRVIWYMPPNANLALREFGIVLFLACVGIKAGGHFFEILLHGDGFLWMGWGAVITLVPLLIAGFFARAWLKSNFMDVCGLLAGSMTDPPALAFANSLAGADAPSVAYATVYPLTMLLRIVVAQLLVLLFV